MTKRRQPINPEQWLSHFVELRHAADAKIIKQAMDLYDSKSHALLEKGLSIADILLSLGLDTETLASALAYPALQVREIHLDSIVECLGEGSSKLLNDVLQMQSLGKLKHLEQRGSHQIENLRKMLLAMVTDVRSVLIVLAERLWQLRQAKELDKTSQQQLANETLTVYAPLANRLGVWQLKWEIEDLCLRYLHPDIYKQIAKGIASRRDEREIYIENFTKILNDSLTNAGIKKFEISGRVKHIYSIYKKMLRKNANLEQIYDMSALRVLVNNIEDCYSVLGVLQSGWQQVPQEFDDYISQPKINGYQSIHTVLIGPENFFIEVQIRTYQMHQESELGVAAHWRYKEGVLQPSSYESKIALLRQIMAWQKEVVNADKEQTETDTDTKIKSGTEAEIKLETKTETQKEKQTESKTEIKIKNAENQKLEQSKLESSAKDLFAERIYVFTPTGDIIDLPQGATPLDFAYTIHSEVGHRCRGAKVDGHIVPLTYELSMGQRVEILTAKQANPSRDWISPHLKYLKSASNRAKVQHWFRVKDSQQNTITGRELIDKELKKLNINHKIDLDAIAIKLHHKNTNDLLAALAAGDVRMTQITHFLIPATQNEVPHKEIKINAQQAPDIQIVGINNLLTHIARCCKPLPGDAVVGYVTRNRGLSIHKRDCGNMLSMLHDTSNRTIEVNWGEKKTNSYPADLLVKVYDRPGLLRDITAMLASEKINVSGLRTQKSNDSMIVDIYLTIEIMTKDQFKIALNHLQNLPNVIQVRRR